MFQPPLGKTDLAAMDGKQGFEDRLCLEAPCNQSMRVRGFQPERIGYHTLSIAGCDCKWVRVWHRHLTPCTAFCWEGSWLAR